MKNFFKTLFGRLFAFAKTRLFTVRRLAAAHSSARICSLPNGFAAVTILAAFLTVLNFSSCMVLFDQDEIRSAYTVECYIQNTTDDDYTIEKNLTQVHDGTAGNMTDFVPKKLEGLTAQAIEQKKIRSDRTTVIQVYYTRNIVTLTFDTDGGTQIEKITGKYGAPVTKPANPSKTGYEFTAWTPNIPSAIPPQDSTYQAQWVAGEGTPYKVEHYKQNVLDDGYTLVIADTETKTGTTGSTTVAVAKTYTGFTAKDITQGTILADGTTVVKVYYDRKAVTLTFNTDGGSTVGAITAKYGAPVSVTPPTKTGYTFASWNPTLPATMPESDTTYTAVWANSTDTPYKVEHWQQNIEDDGYTLVTAETETKTGTTGSTTVATAKTYTGFTAKDIEQGTILADGTTVVKVYYDRKLVTLTFNTAGGSTVGAITAKYGAPVTPPANPTKTGYTFTSWNPTLPSTMPAENATYTAVWANSTDTPYKVEHYKQNVLDDGYTLVIADTETKTGTTGSTTVAVAKTYTGFTAKDITQGTILADGTTVVKVYYDRKAVTLTFNTDGGSTVGAITAKYGAPVSVTPPTKTGYTFASWNPTLPSTMPAEDKTYTAKWTANKYTVAFNANGGIGTMQSQGFTYDIAQNLSANTFTKNGYIFTGWNTKSNGTGTNYSAGQSVKNLTSINNATVTLYAQWMEGILVTAENVASVIAGLTGEGPHKIVVTGEITESTIRAIKTALQNNRTAKVDLDLSATTGLSSLPNSAFYECTSLTSVTIPSSVTTIGTLAFSGCKSLTSVTIPSSVTSIGNYAFYYCTSLTSLIVDEANSNYKSVDNIIYTKDGKTLVCAAGGLTSADILQGVTTIGNYAFYNCTSLTSVTIPSSVTSIGYSPFAACTSLTSLTVEEANENYKSVDNIIYTKDGKTLVCAAGGITSADILQGVTTIWRYAFEGCKSLSSVTIPSSVTSIGSGAFYNCTSLTSLVFEDTSTWYRTRSSYDWRSKIYGTQTDLTAPSTNATYFTSTYRDNYWYKLD